MKIGYFALENDKNLVTADDITLGFARNDMRDVRWYGEGKIEANDIIIYIGRQAAEAGVQEAASLKPTETCDGDVEVVIFRYGDVDFIPFYKKTDANGGVLVDTVYSGETIKITAEDAFGHKSFLIEAGESERKVEDNSSVNMIIVKRGRISFFSKAGDTAEDIKRILDMGCYPAYNEERAAVQLDELFDEELSEKIAKLKEPGETLFFDWQGRPCAIKLMTKGDVSCGRRIFSIGCESQYLESIKADTAIYDKLYFEDRIKIGDNELGCEARLRGCGKNIEQINRKLDKVCRKNVTIVLTGESGTGKTFLAGEIHRNSRRSEGPFINVNCAAIAYNLIESELFGYEEGAFTGARKGGKIGYFEMAKGGTLFLDEISELPFLLQGKLLEVLQEGTFYRVGGIKKISADVRLIVATNRDLEKMVKTGRFREDLYYRINVFPINLPPLRDRINDLESIVGDALPVICERLETDNLMLTNGALEKMKKYGWPGNIRELENVLEKAAVMAEGSFIREEDIILDNPIAQNHTPVSLEEKMDAYEKEIVKETFLKFDGNRRKAAEELGISKTNLFEKIHKYGIDEKMTGEDA